MRADEAARVAVVVVNWNDTAGSIGCLRSVAAEAPGVRLVLVDNGSEPDPSQAIRESVPEARVVRLDRNLGYAGACNVGAGVAFAEGARHVLLLNNDTTIERRTIPALVEASERHPSAILCPLIVYAARPDRVWSAGGFLVGPLLRNHHIGQDEPASAHQVERRVEWATGCALFVSDAAYRRVGPLDDRYFLYLEDTDWCLSAARRGVATWYIPSAVVRHEVSRAVRAAELREHVRYYAYRNQYRMALRHARPWWKPLVIADALYTLGRAGARSLISPAKRHEPYYHARTRGVVDFLLGRSGPMRVRQAQPVRTEVPVSG